jgi:ABC-2 type transport system permease protein
MLAALIRKELLALGRDPHGLAVLFLMPVMFIVIMSLALKDVYAPALKSMRYAVDTRDAGELAQAWLGAWQRQHGAPQPLAPDWPAQLRNAQLKYVLVLEPGLSDELALPSLPSQVRLRLLTEPGIDANLFNALRAELTGIAGEVKARHALASLGGEAAPPGASMAALVHAERFSSSGPRPSSVQQNVPAWLVFGMFFVVASMTNLFVHERNTGTLARLQSLGVTRPTLLAAKAIPYLGVNAVQAVLMLAVGVWLMPLIGGEALSLRGIDWVALGVALAAVSLAAVGLALALGCVVRTHAQAAAVGPVANVLMGAVGGIMVPKFVMPAFMHRVAECSPMDWGLEALLSVLLRGGGVASTLPHVLRLVGFAAVMFMLALWLFQRRAR